MPGSPNISQKTIKPDPGITIKKEPSSPPKKDLKGSLESLRIGSSRLPSFRGPRDLTLSSLASSSSSSSLQTQSRPKRTFVPNIPVRRERGEKVIESRSERSTKRVPNIVKHERGRGRGRGREKEFIQTKGSLFGEGIAASAVAKKSSDYGGSGSGGGREGTGGTKAGEMRMPYLNKDAASSFNKEYEARMLDEIKRDNLTDDPDEESIPERDAPRVLPFIKLDEENKNIKKEDLKMEDNTMESTISNENKRLKIKQEPGLEPKTENNEKQTETSLEETNKFPKNSVAYSLLTKKENEFIYLQLPTCLPAYPPEEPHQAAGSSTSAGGEARPEHDSNINTGFLKSSSPRCTLGTLPEGQIGNLRIYESGRVELCLGNHVLNVDKGVPVACLQDSVKITVDSENNTGSMSVLGHVKDRFVITPDFERIVKGLRNL